MSGATWLASYPRSGNTWARFALMAALGELEQPSLDQLDKFARAALDRGEIDWLIEVDSADFTEAESLEVRAAFHRVRFANIWPSPIVKIHDKWQALPNGDSMQAPDFTHGAIYLVRDPRDVALSWAALKGYDVDWAIRFMADPEAHVGRRGDSRGPVMSEFLGTWSDHVISWIDEAPYPVLVVRYEDMLADPSACLAQMIKVIGQKVCASAVDRAVAASQFDRLATLERDHGFRDRPASTDRFFRAGRAGEWRERLTPEQVSAVSLAHGEVMARLGYL